MAGKSLGALSRGLKKHEALMLAVGIGASSISALAACVAAYLTLKQVRLLEEDRTAAFELSALAERRAAVRDILKATAEYEEAATCYTSMASSRKFGRPPGTADYRACNAAVREKAQAFMISARSYLPTLPRHYRDQVFRYGDAANVFNLCEFDRPLLRAANLPADIAATNRQFCTKSTEEGFRELQQLSVGLTSQGVELVENGTAAIDERAKKAGPSANKLNSTAPAAPVVASPPTGATVRPLALPPGAR